MSNAGSALIEELRQRGLAGAFLDYADYRTLRCLKTWGEVRGFLSERGYPCEEATDDLGEICQILLIHGGNYFARRSSGRTWLGWRDLVLSFPLLIGAAIWLFWLIFS